MNKLRIITYHYVRDVEDTNFPGIKAISTEDFTKQIDWISKTGTVIKQQQLIDTYDKKTKLPDNSFLLTFDDGYKDHINNVLPVLKEYGMTAVFFLPVKAIIERDILVANKIQHILGVKPDLKEITKKIFKGLIKHRNEYNLKSDEQYWKEYAIAGRFDGPEVKFIKNMLQTALPKPVRSSILDDIFQEYVTKDQQEFANKLYLNLEDIKKLKQKGMEIQSHGYEHERLEFMTKQEQEKDTRKAVKQFDKLGIDKNNWTMCYPYGSYNKETEEVLREQGCQAGYSTKGKITNTNEVGRFEINRMDTTELITERMQKISTLDI